jgi:tetratricopeptide (TPR) repeat protein
MYPYLTPHGLILKLNNQPTPITPQLIADDTAFWNWYTQRLTTDPRFMRDIVARKSFSKLRTAIAALYSARGLPSQAEAAYRQAIELYDLSPESNFRLANLLASNNRFEEAIALITTLQNKDPKNVQLQNVRNQLKQRQKLIQNRDQLEARIQNSAPALSDLLNLQQLYTALGDTAKANHLIKTLIENPNISPDILTQIIDLLSRQRNYTTAKTALYRLIQLQPDNLQAKANLAIMHLLGKEENPFWNTLEQMVNQHGNSARNLLNTDQRFQHLKQHPRFKQIYGNPPRSSFPINL